MDCDRNGDAERRHDRARPIPRISIQAFCRKWRHAEALQVGGGSPLVESARQHHMGGAQARVAHYRQAYSELSSWIGTVSKRCLPNRCPRDGLCAGTTVFVIVPSIRCLYRECGSGA